MADLGVQATARIIAAADPLQMLSDITAVFPSAAAAISRDTVDASLKLELDEQQDRLPTGSRLLVNGLAV